jgi:hypothetical protein
MTDAFVASLLVPLLVKRPRLHRMHQRAWAPQISI